jgi:hypothetical protein
MWHDFDPYQELMDTQEMVRELTVALKHQAETINRLIEHGITDRNRITTMQRDIQNLNNRLTRAERG